MGKFVNPKKIKGQDKLNRIKDLMGKMGTLTESKTFSELELIKKGPNGVVYGIIRENHDYFIKTTEKTSGIFLSEDFKYVGGLQNKYNERYKSYAEAIKHLNMKFDMLNESFGIKENNNIFESDGVPTANASGGIKSGGLGFVMENPEEDHPDQSCWEAHEKDQIHQEECRRVPVDSRPVVRYSGFGFTESFSALCRTFPEALGGGTRYERKHDRATSLRTKPRFH